MTDDVLARIALPEDIDPGDVLVWMHAGAYHLPWETRFSQGLCAVAWCDEAERLSLAREREQSRSLGAIVDPVTRARQPVRQCGRAARTATTACSTVNGWSAPATGRPPSPLTAFVHDGFRALILNEHFSCVAAKAAVRQGDYRFGLYDALGSVARVRWAGARSVHVRARRRRCRDAPRVQDLRRQLRRATAA